MKIWICENNIWLSIIISGIELIITAILTFIIIHQTNKNNDSIQKLEKQISEREAHLQQQQLKLELFPYKREIYRHLISIFSVCELYDFLDKKIKLKEKDAQQLVDIFDTICKQADVNKQHIRKDLLESEYIFPERISIVIGEVAERFEELCASFAHLGTVEKMLTEQEKTTIMPEMVEKTIIASKENCTEILKCKMYLVNQIPADMDISKTTERYQI